MVNRVSKVLWTIEIGAVVVAAVFGYLWYRDPGGESYEPVTFLALLVGSTMVEMIRRFIRTPAPTQDCTSKDVFPAEPHQPAGPDVAMRVQHGTVNLDALANREVHVRYPEPFLVRPNLEVQVDSVVGNKVVIVAEDASGFTAARPGFWVGGCTNILQWRATGSVRT